ncbi:MAG: dephospho-CoA kinase [Lachnospiraceae bacterium]|nr:dephospho-CoA kinase [Lachnospiraceae bacterium]
MQVIGITGGVGAGKSVILEYLQENYKVRNLEADRIAEMLMEPGTECYDKLMKFLPVEIYNEDETINRPALAEKLFESPQLRQEVNKVVHPAVKEYISERIEEQRQMRILDYVIIEAALLIEDHYDKICDEIWYVYATEETRRQRLLESRKYTREKIKQMFASQMPEEEYRSHCQIVIDNNGSKEEAFYQVAQLIKDKGESGQVEEQQIEGIPLVFGLDIGTRNVVGTVGYRQEEEFFVLAQYVKEHETRSMLDGQIHDIGRVGRTINTVKKELESQLQIELNDVCIAAAGRVLKTVTTTVSYEFDEEKVITGEDIHTLDLLGIEKAQRILNENNDTKFKFYCVGYSVVKYYLNGDTFSNLENHKADEISEDVIVTFLPEDVVDGLYSAVGIAGLRVANMTLEPIAAINVAIPETFRMLNIALVDIGAGTSDISVTRDGSIIAYGMIPSAGDELTELLVQHYLVDFKTAENIKLQSGLVEEIEYQDIMMIKHTVTAEEVWELLKPLVDDLAESIAAKIKELNGGETVSATFVVGGGGKIHGFIEHLSNELGLPQERVALRGEEVLQEIHFEQEDIRKDPLLVTPIGICLNYYDQKNNFIFVHFNGERIKLYDNDKLTIVDAALQAGFPNEQLFPRRGREINFTVNGRKRIARGEAGESAVVRVNGHLTNINASLEPNSDITIEPSTQGSDAVCRLDDLEEYGNSMLNVEVNGKLISCPRYAEVNGVLEMPDYEIKENDRVEMRGYYTVSQIIEFMDVEIDMEQEILVNNKPADLDTLVYENFSIEWTVQAFRTPQSEMEDKKKDKDKKENDVKLLEVSEDKEDGLKKKSKLQKKIEALRNVGGTYEEAERELSQEELEEKFIEEQKDAENDIRPTIIEKAEQRVAKRAAAKMAGIDLHITVNKMPVTLTGKKSYVFVDVFDVIGFDVHAGNGRSIVTLLNGESPSYTAGLSEGDVLDIYWED